MAELSEIFGASGVSLHVYQSSHSQSGETRLFFANVIYFRDRVDVGSVAAQSLTSSSHDRQVFTFRSVAGVATMAFGIWLALPSTFSGSHSSAGYVRTCRATIYFASAIATRTISVY